MTAKVIAYSASAWDTSLTLKWECLRCRTEGGWTSDGKDAFNKVQKLADAHNTEVHQKLPHEVSA